MSIRTNLACFEKDSNKPPVSVMHNGAVVNRSIQTMCRIDPVFFLKVCRADTAWALWSEKEPALLKSSAFFSTVSAEKTTFNALRIVAFKDSRTSVLVSYSSRNVRATLTLAFVAHKSPAS